MKKFLAGICLLIVLLLALIGGSLFWTSRSEIPQESRDGIRSKSREISSFKTSTGSPQNGSPIGTAPQKPTISYSDGLSSVLKKHLKGASNRTKSHPSRTPRLSHAFDLALVDLRLLALSYPSESIRSAEELVSDPTRPNTDRYCGVYLLWALTDHGDSLARARLQGLCNSPDPYISEVSASLATLLADTSGFHQVFQTKALMGQYDCLKALGELSDTASSEVLQQVSAKGGAEGMVAEESLAQQALLKSGRVNETLEQILAGKGAERSHWLPWALRIAPRWSLPGFQNILRERLDRVLNQYKSEFVARDLEFSEKGGDVDAAFQTDYSRSFGIALYEHHYDDLLISLASTGAKMNDLERKRLRFLGYDGNPADRLSELLSGPR